MFQNTKSYHISLSYGIFADQGCAVLKTRRYISRAGISRGSAGMIDEYSKNRVTTVVIVTAINDDISCARYQAWQAFYQLLLPSTLRGSYYCQPHYTDGETDLRKDRSTNSNLNIFTVNPVFSITVIALSTDYRFLICSLTAFFPQHISSQM